MTAVKPYLLFVLFIFSIITGCGKKTESTSGGNFIENPNPDSSYTYKNVFDIPELSVSKSPDSALSLDLSGLSQIIDYAVSPAGPFVAVLNRESENKGSVGFWEIGKSEFSEILQLPEGFKPLEITWHPRADALFILGYQKKLYTIYRFIKENEKWKETLILSSSLLLSNLLFCPRPFITEEKYEPRITYYQFRLFFGMDNGDGSFRTCTITESGKRFYQVAGPAKTFTGLIDSVDFEQPSAMEADWILPVAFHPAGHELLFRNKKNEFLKSKYYKAFYDLLPAGMNFENKGVLLPTPNGLGLVHWIKDQSGVGIYYPFSNMEETQLPEYSFTVEPALVPDGKGLVALTETKKGQQTLNFLPIKVPLPDVVNAWMFISTGEELALFQKQQGLFRTEQGEQLYQLYETENYYCDSYDRNAPTRPYLVTTDIFWELVGAAFQGLFIVRERDLAIPSFWKFVSAANSFYSKPGMDPEWAGVFSTLEDLKSGKDSNKEVLKILKADDAFSIQTGKLFDFSNLKPRGHYSSDPELTRYFQAFKYLTSIYSHDQAVIKKLNGLPPEIKKLAESWTNSYVGFIAPSRSPIVWDLASFSAPDYCRFPGKKTELFPLSWGFDNEALFSSVFQREAPRELQVTGAEGRRLLPSGLDFAASLNNSLATTLLEPEIKKYPPLIKVMNGLKSNFSSRSVEMDKKSLYPLWINTLALQWADMKPSKTIESYPDIMKVKRLQTGLASWATLRHATVLVNERGVAECGEGGFEELLMRAPRGYVEPDPATFGAIAGIFEAMTAFVSPTIQGKIDPDDLYSREPNSFYDGILRRLKETAAEARSFQVMAEKQQKGEPLSNAEYEKILFVARIAEHNYLIFNSLANKEYAFSHPDPMSKITDVFGSVETGYLLSGVGNAMEWDFTVPFYGRKQLVKGSVYSYYEFTSRSLLNDEEWREVMPRKTQPLWIQPFTTQLNKKDVPLTGY